jgi:voltage-gated potassium channel
MTTARAWLHHMLERSDPGSGIARWVDIALITLIALIALNVLAVTLETVEPLYARYAVWFDGFDRFSVVVFTLEYIGRLWACVEHPRYQDRWRRRLRYALTPMALIDLLAILPFYLGLFFDADLRFLRALRLLRVFKLTRYSTALTLLLDVLQEEASTLFAGFFILFILLILAASGAYLVEHQVQPDVFGSVPQAMWWALVTLTTVGYGDVTPITAGGRVFGDIVTIIGVGMAALPAGILASGLADHLHRRRDDLRQQFRIALQDGVIDEDEEEEIEALRKKLGLSSDVARQVRNEIDATRRENGTCTCPRCGLNFTAEFFR